ncbi:SDR family oxidoreductase [Parafrankia sp. EUN1f]|uniref:SDR family oxidoreductase n=1 Tax=Parafrankia sp. EUN1f TaxID=102897 RepID=UPI0001C445DF|nr:SDR family oxidoreductase [Parafrankia sp. EUN1f]EFC86731.1 short-chain dehydrogenase/reductase SDR [Parafrankia sp. EUN1f]
MSASSSRAQDRHIAVLGGSAGIGFATARLLADRGAAVTIGGRNRGRLEAAVKELGGSARGIQVDAEDVDALRRFFSETGPISDLVVTVTRRGGAGPAAELADTDLAGAFLGKSVAHLRAVALAMPTLAADGSITLVTAGSAQAALPGTAGLAAVNGALEAAVPPLAVELAPRRVNAVSPGVIETGWWDELPADARRAALDEFAGRAPVRRNGRPDEVAAAIVAVLENGFITGVVLPCDGGLRLV